MGLVHGSKKLFLLVAEAFGILTGVVIMTIVDGSLSFLDVLQSLFSADSTLRLRLAFTLAFACFRRSFALALAILLLLPTTRTSFSTFWGIRDVFLNNMGVGFGVEGLWSSSLTV